MFNDNYQQTLHAFRAAGQASKIAGLWYDLLWTAYENLEYRLHTPYHGLIISSVFDAKAVAFRARPVEQVDFGFVMPSYEAVLDDSDNNVLHGYYEAYLAERDAWSLYQANYNQLALLAAQTWPRYNVWCQDTGKAPAVRNDTKFCAFDNGKIRVLEVKPVK